MLARVIGSPLSVGDVSEVLPVAPRADVRAPLVMERLLPPARTAEMFTYARQFAALVNTLPPPWQRLIDAQFSPMECHFLYERFVGVTLHDVSRGLRRSGRVLPLEVVRAVVEAISQAFEHGVAVRGWPQPREYFAVTDRSIGLSLDGRWHFAPAALNEWLYEVPHPNIWNDPERALPRLDSIALLSPEAIRAAPETSASAVTRTALLSWQLITGGHHPFRGRPYELAQSLTRFLHGQVLVPLSVHPELGAELAQVFTRALAFRDNRFAGMQEFRAALERAWPKPAASVQRTLAVLASVAWPAMERALTALKREPMLPLQWDGVWTTTQAPEAGLSVVEDQLLERLEPLDGLPLRGPFEPPRSPPTPPPITPVRVEMPGRAAAPPPVTVAARVGLLRRILDALRRR
jgi:hypothetical protein